jgi:carboxylesterase type B
MAFSYNLFDGDDVAEGEVLGFHRNTPENRALAHLWTDTMAQFMRTGNPNWPGIANWPPYDTTKRATLALREAPIVVEDLDGKEARFAYGLAV